MKDIVLRYNSMRMVAVFETQEDLNKWIEFYHEPQDNDYMLTLHFPEGRVESFDKYKKTCLKIW